jgi:hypothetical protein
MQIAGILVGVSGLVAFVCWIMVLVKMFKTQESPLMGIIGIFCSLWALIWGWMNAGKYGLTKIMVIWTVATIVCAGSYAKLAAELVKMAQEQSMQLTPTITEPATTTPPAEVAPEEPAEDAAPE